MKNRGFEISKGYEEKNIRLPRRKTARSAGYDIEAAADCELLPHRVTLVPTGIKAYMQPDEVLTIHIRSSMAVKHQLVLVNSVGIIDADYYDNPDNEGHIYIALWNRGSEPFAIEKGDRIAQGIFGRYLVADDDSAGQGAERQGGFGSTGKG